MLTILLNNDIVCVYLDEKIVFTITGKDAKRIFKIHKSKETNHAIAKHEGRHRDKHLKNTSKITKDCAKRTPQNLKVIAAYPALLVTICM